jgi:hypothetical protein
MPTVVEKSASKLRAIGGRLDLTGPTLFSKVSSEMHARSCGFTPYHQHLPLPLLPTAVQNADIRHHTDVAINASWNRNRHGNEARQRSAIIEQ